MALLETNNTNIEDKTEHILVGLSAAPSNAKIVQTAAKMAKAFKGSFTALYVKTPGADNMSEEDRKRLDNNIRLAEKCGATITTVYGEDISFQIAEYARLSGITKIVVGRSAVGRKKLFGKPTLTEQLIMVAPNIDIHIIPDSMVSLSAQKSKIVGKRKVISTVKDFALSLLILCVATLFGFLFSQLGFTEANIITIYILGVLITSVLTNNKLCWVLSSIASVLVFNFLFTHPKFTFLAYDKGYPITFGIMLIASIITGLTAEKMKSQAKQASKAAYRTKILFDANQLIQKAETDKEIVGVTADQLRKLLKRDVVVVMKGQAPIHYSFSGIEDCSLSEETNKIIESVMNSNQRAGAGSENYSMETSVYFPISANQMVYGVIVIYIEDRPIDSFENSILHSIVGECALALESKHNAREKELSAVLAKNEQLRANLLRAISHDLRTPLTAISGHANNLMTNGESFDDQTKLRIYSDIYNDSMWLINLVENLLSVTRLEEGRMNVNFTTELVDEVISEALKHVNKNNVGQRIKVIHKEELLLAKMDVRLIVQVVINLIDNAIKYTKENCEIVVTTCKSEGKAIISVSDNGPGIADEQKKHVFDMFYTGTNKIADSRRSLGMGLALCKSIITAHGGEITVTDNKPNGTVFTFTLPAGEVETNE